MCDKNHNHGLVETWVTPKESTRLRSKLVQLEPGQEMPRHTTGPGREEVITCIFGEIQIVTDKGNTLADFKTLTAGEAYFIPENTFHRIINDSTTDHALYCFVVTIPDEQRNAERMAETLEQAWS